MFFPQSAGEETTRDSAAWETVILVLSHVGFPAVAAYLIAVLGDLYLGAHALAVFVFSDVYHLCRGNVLCFGLTLEHARLLDHITSLSATVAVLLTVLYLHPTAGVPARVFAPFVIAYAVLAFPFQTQALVIIGAFLMVLVADRYLRQGVLTVPDARRFNIGAVFVALALALAAYGLFMVDSWGYAIPHAIWHLLVSAALYFAAVGIRKSSRTGSFWCCCR